MSSLLSPLVRAGKKTIGSVSQGTLFDELVAIPVKYAPLTPLYRSNLDAIDEKINTFASRHNATTNSPKVQNILTNFNILLAFYRLRAIADPVAREAEYGRVFNIEFPKKKQPGSTNRDDGTLAKSYNEILKINGIVNREISSDPVLVKRRENALARVVAIEIERTKAIADAKAEEMVQAGEAPNKEAALAWLKMEPGPRAAKKLEYRMSKISRLGGARRRQTRRKQAKAKAKGKGRGKKSTRRR